MVYQSEYTSYALSKLTEDAATCEVGESTTVTFEDNALDTVHDTVSTSGISTTVVDDRIQYVIDISSGIAVGDNLNANLLKVNGTVSVNKVKYTDILKTDTIVIQDIMTMELLVQ